MIMTSSHLHKFTFFHRNSNNMVYVTENIDNFSCNMTRLKIWLFVVEPP